VGKVRRVSAATRAKAAARQKADRAANPEKYRLIEAARYQRHEAARTEKQRRERSVRNWLRECRREISRRPAFGQLSDELRYERSHFVTDDDDMSVWERMIVCAQGRRLEVHDDRVGDAAYRWLRSVNCVT
jgi:hypothetical protein